jgi:hypothetical protein
MFQPHVEQQLEDLNLVPCSSIDLLSTHLDHTRFQVSTVILRIQLVKARLPLGVTWRLACVTKCLHIQRRNFTVPHQWLTYLSSSTWLLSWESMLGLPYVSACCKEWDFLRGRDVCIVGVDLETETTNYNYKLQNDGPLLLLKIPHLKLLSAICHHSFHLNVCN